MTSVAITGITELVTNAVEHGLAGRDGEVQITATRREDFLTVQVRDDGVGLPEGKVGSGLGTQIVRTLIQGELGGTIDWHTLEGPAVLDDGSGGCVLLYSGGNWQTPGYGVAVARAPVPTGPWHEDPAAAPLVTSASTGLLGPGHCSVLTDEQDHHSLFLHAWDPSASRRRPHRMELVLEDGRPRVGPPSSQRTSTTPAPVTEAG